MYGKMYPVQNLSTHFNFSPPKCLFTASLLFGSQCKGVLSRVYNVKGKIERNFFRSPNIFPSLTF